MSASLASFTATVDKLIHRFESDRTHYLSKSYSEAQARVDFITPFFKALGWDVENEEGLPHHAREVVVELGEDTQGRPDYGFRLAGQTKFFVEAKAPSEALDTARHIMQAKKYAWNTKQVSFVLLTDFEEFRFYDASIIPDERKPDEGLLLNFRYTDYLANIAKLWDFSPERVAAGSLEALLPRDRRTQRLRIPVDTAFLDEMTGWREELAKNIYKNNPALTARQLNEVVQRLLDRIVFIRVAEDRRVIEKNQLRDVVEEWKARRGKFHIFEGLNDLFHRINEDFNGEIFKQHLSDKIKIDSEVLARIIERLYPPKSPYRFDVIGVELLGSIYERYLGKTIRVTPKQVRVEERPEVRKAGGVYYTPKYIVDYIVKNTVGKLIEGKTPKQIEKIRILDPACGSGSFLIGAFQCLIDYHARYLSEHPKEARVDTLLPDVTKDPNGEPRLSVIRKAQILKNNLFGVDIDPQAVEITMMSLYLKALEGERSQLPPKQHLLPELKNNIICGNSLIGPDFYKDQQLSFIDDEEKYRVNVFDWQTGFPEIVKGGGFDCVIGNPPYVRPHRVPPFVKKYLWREFKSYVRKSDILNCFLEKGISVCRERGLLGMITSDTWRVLDSSSNLRRLILESCAITNLHLYAVGVFEHVSVKPVVVTLRREPDNRRRMQSDTLVTDEEGNSYTVPQSRWATSAGFIVDTDNPQVAAIKRKMEAGELTLGNIVTVDFGLKTADDVKFVRTRQESKADKPLVASAEVGRYNLHWDGGFVWYRPELMKAKTTARPGEPERFERDKLIISRMADGLIGTFDRSRFYVKDALLVALPQQGYDLRFLLGVINSKALNFWYSTTFVTVDTHRNELMRVPLPPVDLSNPDEKARHDKTAALVERMLELNKKKQSGKLAPSELDRLERELAATDAQINDLVYDLYAITPEERKIIEAQQ